MGHRGCLQHILAGAALHTGGGKEADVPVGNLTWRDRRKHWIFLILLQGREAVSPGRLHRRCHGAMHEDTVVPPARGALAAACDAQGDPGWDHLLPCPQHLPPHRRLRTLPGLTRPLVKGGEMGTRTWVGSAAAANMGMFEQGAKPHLNK